MIKKNQNFENLGWNYKECIRKRCMFWFYKYCSTYTLKFHSSDILLSAITIANHVQTDRLISCKDKFWMISRSVWTWFAMVIVDSSMITRISCRAKVCWWIDDVNVCKKQRWAPNIRGVEFHGVGRTIFIK